jgi:hypothetical protein
MVISTPDAAGATHLLFMMRMGTTLCVKLATEEELTLQRRNFILWGVPILPHPRSFGNK